MNDIENILDTIRGYLIGLEDNGFKTIVRKIHSANFIDSALSDMVIEIVIANLDEFKLDNIKEDISFIIDYLKRYNYSINHADGYQYIEMDCTGSKKNIIKIPYKNTPIIKITMKFVNKFEMY